MVKKIVLPNLFASKAAMARLSSSILALILSISSSVTNFGPYRARKIVSVLLIARVILIDAIKIIDPIITINESDRSKKWR